MQKLLKSTQFKSVEKIFKKTDFSKETVYADWLAQTYYFVSHSVPLLKLCAENLAPSSPIRERMIEHVEEEAQHELLAKKDIETLGFKIENFQLYPATNSLYQTQYMQIQHKDPHAFLGYILMLEAFAVELGPWLESAVKTNYKKTVNRFIHVHANEDIKHIESAFNAIKFLPKESQLTAEENFFGTCNYYSEMMRSIQKNSQISKVRVA